MGTRDAAPLLPDRPLAQADRLLGGDDDFGREGPGRERFRNAFVGREFTHLSGELADVFTEALDDDFNTPEALALMHEWVNELRLDFLHAGLEVFGLESLAVSDDAPTELVQLADRRREARSSRDFAEADRLRTEIEDAGWEVRDVAEEPGYQLVPKR